ncbi:hypothetical protein CK203_114508 [Vitis vinifera]|uniref:Uncharacterized protein n=1 Tax=Vitis vinifera TaxID=29760 RepID=A0A438C9P6_VITVI|nr:hypothetical protein CK203_114508 [Vitis vinifera]
MRGSACVEVMTTLHGSAPSLRRRAEGCVLPEDPPIRTPSLHVGVSEAFRASLVTFVFVLDAFARFSSDYHSFHTFPIPYPHSASHLARIRFHSQSGHTFLGQS